MRSALDRLQPGQVETLFRLGSWTDSVFETAERTLEGLQPASVRLDVVRGLSIALKESIENVEISRLIDCLIVLEVMRAGQPWTEADLARRLSTAKGESGWESGLEADSSLAAARAVKLLAKPSVQGLAKIEDLATGQGRQFRDARILIDLRPVFGSDVSDEPEQFVLMHTLKLQYADGGIDREFHVSMTLEDLKRLEGLLARERQKLSSVTRLIRQVGGSIIDVYRAGSTDVEITEQSEPDPQ